MVMVFSVWDKSEACDCVPVHPQQIFIDSDIGKEFCYYIFEGGYFVVAMFCFVCLTVSLHNNS